MQLLQLRRQIPPLYVLLAVNSAALAFTHQDVAPIGMTLVLPALLIASCLYRIVAWTLPLHPRYQVPAAARARMRQMTRLSVAMSLAFIVWSLALDRYGGPYEQGHVATFVSVTVLGCIFCLGYLPRAAIAVCAIVVGSFLGYCLWRGSDVLIAIAVNIALVAIVILKVLQDSFQAFLQLHASKRELTAERQQAQRLSEENARLAHTDPLTGLPNRRYFFGELDAALARADDATRFCVGVIDLDGFKAVNDTYGHATGDRLLQAIAERLRTSCSADVVVARLGGDEFGILLHADAETATRFGQRLCDAIRQPVTLTSTTVTLGCSAGLAAFPEAGADANSLFDRSDFALYRAKLHQRGACVLFSAELEQLIRSERALDAALQAADLDRELSVVFQPIFATDTLQIVAVETLARWTSPRIGPVHPELLIAASERLGIARSITLALFDRALAGAQSLPNAVRVSFNLSAVDLADEGTITAVMDRLVRSGVDPRRLVFEITESSFIADLSHARRSLEILRSTGAGLALDDFGTGYSSLGTLHQLPFDILKIDRSFASRLDDVAGRRLIGAIRSLGASLSLECVIEGIETETQLMEATLAGFRFAQGYLLGRPVPVSEVRAILSAGAEAA